MINAIRNNTGYEQKYSANEKVKSKAEKIENTEQSQDSVVLEIGNTENASVTYSKPASKGIDQKEIERLWKETERATASLRDMVERLISRQGKNLEKILTGEEILLIDDEARVEAEKAISEDGEWGVKAVSDRIVSFAKAISGGDKSKAAELRDAIVKGFEEAEKAFGGTLPDICGETYDEVMRKLDEWENEE